MLSNKSRDKLDELIYGICCSLLNDGKDKRGLCPDTLDALLRLMDGYARIVGTDARHINVECTITNNGDDAQRTADKIVEIIGKELGNSNFTV